MDIKISRNSLLALAKTAGSASERSSALPILSCVRLSGSDGVVSVCGSDLQCQVQVTGVASFSEPFSLAINAKKLMDIVGNLSQDSDVRMVSEGGRISVRSGKSRFSLQTLPGGDFPLMEVKPTASTLKVSRQALLRILKMVDHASAVNDVRYYLNGTNISISDGVICAVATNGHRLAVAQCSISESTGPASLSFILPSKAVTEIVRALSAGGFDFATMAISDSSAVFRLGGVEISCKLIDGRYPDWRRVVPPAAASVISIPTSVLREALSRARIVSDDRLRGVRLVAGRASLTVESTNSSDEQCGVEIDISNPGNGFSGGWNVDYLLDVLAAIDATEVTISHSGENAPLVFDEPKSGFKAVVMSMRI